jgi:hypothetical protein
VWHIGRVEVEDGFLYGLLGFEGSGTAELWNEDTKDFQEAATPVGVASPFAIDLSNLGLAFQTRSQDIQVTSFIGAMQKILREATGEEWSIEAVRATMSFSQWRATVRVVYQMRFRVEPPNPNYEGRPDLKRLIEDANLNVANIDLHSDSGIVTDADIVRQLLEHGDLGYGPYVAVGNRVVNDQDVETVYSSALHGETEIAVRPANPETGEVERETLKRELTGPSDVEHAGEHG